MTPASPEYQMIRTYIDWVLDVPWSTYTEDRLDPVAARAGARRGPLRSRQGQGADRRVPGGAEAEGAAGRRAFAGPILCFVGPPGVGKTSLGQSIARAMNRKFVRISLGGVRDEAEIRGHRRTYIGAIPGRIVQALKQAGAMNPVFMLDEIDKISVGYQGDPAAALLEVLDPAQNHSFRDHYLEINVDLSRVLFIATSNQLGTIHPALLDRMEIIFADRLQRGGEAAHRAAVSDSAADRAKTVSTPDQVAIRRMPRCAGSSRSTRARPACAASNGRSARSPQGRRARRRLDAANPHPRRIAHRAAIPDFLGPPRFHDEVAFRVSRPGVATGVAWTETGGDVLFVEASLLPSGHHESDPDRPAGERHAGIGARGGQPHPRRGRATGRLRRNFSTHNDLHVHVPAGAIPKDGPSAGVTMATAIVSALRNQPVREDVAMTGEITLSGLVLPVGGIREKALAARRHGIKTLILPALNEPDLAELPPEVRNGMQFVPASTLEEVLKVALPVADIPM